MTTRNSLATLLALSMVLAGCTAPPSVVDPAPPVAAPTTTPAAPPSTPTPTADPATTDSPPPDPPPSAPVSDAKALLDSLPVKGRAPKTGYDRDRFGRTWFDIDRNGCDTRNDILRRDLTHLQLDPDGCTVLAGTLLDPYTGNTIPFRRGRDTSGDVHIDHVVSLSDAWQKGAQALSDVEREAFGNDPRNLLAVAGPVNAAKGDGDAATWLPPDRDAWCGFTARQVTVKAAYRLWVTAAERDTIAGILAGCPTVPEGVS